MRLISPFHVEHDVTRIAVEIVAAAVTVGNAEVVLFIRQVVTVQAQAYLFTVLIADIGVEKGVSALGHIVVGGGIRLRRQPCADGPFIPLSRQAIAAIQAEKVLRRVFAVVGAFLRGGGFEIFAVIKRVSGVDLPALRKLPGYLHFNALALHLAVGDVAVIAVHPAHGVIGLNNAEQGDGGVQPAVEELPFDAGFVVAAGDRRQEVAAGIQRALRFVDFGIAQIPGVVFGEIPQQAAVGDGFTFHLVVAVRGHRPGGEIGEIGVVGKAAVTASEDQLPVVRQAQPRRGVQAALIDVV